MRTARQEFGAQTTSVASVRRFIRETLNEWGVVAQYEWRATTVVSELATNAVLHACTPFLVCVSLDADRLTLEVRDGSPRLPKVRHYDDDATTGRGMRLIADLCVRWQAQATLTGKTIRCQLDLVEVERPDSHTADNADKVTATMEPTSRKADVTDSLDRAAA